MNITVGVFNFLLCYTLKKRIGGVFLEIMLPQEFIYRKREGKTHTREEMEEFFTAYMQGEIPDYQVSSWLMAVFFQSMTEEETTNLTKIMAESGETLNFFDFSTKTLDKHSTGGVGDKTSLVLAPLMAHFGLKMAKMSGRGLGHSGGTIDKLESIPGFRVDLSREEIYEGIKKVGCVLVSQSKELTPLDGKLYALRDVTATVESIPLIASSVMSKKLAGGAKHIILDVKVGKGAFMKDLENALNLSRLMVKIGEMADRSVVAVLSQMDEPLGCSVGNSLEVIEAIKTLKGKGPPDFNETIITLGSYLLFMSGVVKDLSEGSEMVANALSNGRGLDKFRELVLFQGGDTQVIDDYNLFSIAPIRKVLPSTNSGFVADVDAHDIGLASLILGAGRRKKGDNIDLGAGIVVRKKVGDKVEKGEPVFEIFTSSENKLRDAYPILEKAYKVVDKPIPPLKVILEVVDKG